MSRRHVTVLFEPTGELLCECGRRYTTSAEAKNCTGQLPVPVVPGDTMGAHRAGQAYVRTSTYASAAAVRPAGPHPLLVALLLALLVIVGLLAGALAMRELGGSDSSWQIPDSGYPTTYGPPGPTGGPVLEVAGR